MIAEGILELGIGFKDPDGNHWPRIVTVEHDSAVVDTEPRVVVGCEVVSLNGKSVAGLTHEQALPLMKKRPLELVFCGPLDQIGQQGERETPPAGLMSSGMRPENGQAAEQDGKDDFFGFGQQVESTGNPLGGAEKPSGQRFAAAETFDVEDKPSHRRSKTDQSGQWQDAEKQADPGLYRWGDEDDDIGGAPDTVREKHTPKGMLNLGDQAVAPENGVSGISMYKRRQQQQRNRVIAVVTCLMLLLVYWISLFILHANTHEEGCTQYCEDGAGSA